MQLNATPSPVDISLYPQYVHNCNRSQCEPSWTAPIPAMPYLQVYVNFGTYKPVTIEIYAQEVCDGGTAEQIFPSNYVAGQTPEGNWYGVFKYFNTPIQDMTSFVVWLSTLVDTPAGLVEKTFFSEMMVIEPCAPLTKIKSCQPEGATTTGFDVNGLYYGLPVNVDYLGIEEVRYFHIAYVRIAKAREIAPKATFTGSITRNFRTTVDKNWILETELVPKWFKDVLLAIYLRGAIEVAGVKYLVSDLAFEPINDDDLTWKPYANLKATHRLYFGCDESECVECCSPIVLNAFATFEPESPTLTEDTYRFAEDDEICDSGTIDFLYSAQAFGTGTQMFTDPGLTTPLTGFNFIRQIDDPIIYAINPVNGVVGLPTGEDCTPDPAVVSFRVSQDFNAGQPTNPNESVTVYVSTNGGVGWIAIGNVIASQPSPGALVSGTWNTVIGQGFLFGVLKTTNGQNVSNGVAGSSAFAQCGLVSNPQNQTVTSASQTFNIWIDWDAAGVITTC
jgi:hypothetical protein